MYIPVVLRFYPIQTSNRGVRAPDLALTHVDRYPSLIPTIVAAAFGNERRNSLASDSREYGPDQKCTYIRRAT